MGVLKNILVVDDEAGIRSLLFEVLSNEGFRVTLAKDGKDSLDQMERTRFDLLITDMDMPGLSGMELLRRMKREGRKEKVIVMSGRPLDQEDLGRDVQPVFRTLQKPFPLDNFLEVVASALGPSKKRKGKKRVRAAA
ncbi:MAG: response regulator [Deltaproteobacteria bacterium]|nr:response regulator [Deltaproteobacteria bacterium]MBW2016708.1 response regulator [Deltaproteobacteria bacterium]MBW2129146.1 response regulator [Deltaproteobacteria bacterium]MBW2302464.1 response regulator [Deltaproteobacteria bacterium]